VTTIEVVSLKGGGGPGNIKLPKPGMKVVEVYGEHDGTCSAGRKAIRQLREKKVFWPSSNQRSLQRFCLTTAVRITADRVHIIQDTHLTAAQQ
jgi:hypothetical protein